MGHELKMDRENQEAIMVDTPYVHPDLLASELTLSVHSLQLSFDLNAHIPPHLFLLWRHCLATDGALPTDKELKVSKSSLFTHQPSLYPHPPTHTHH